MQLYYTTNIQDPHFYLDEQETKHAIKVLRKKIGDTVQAVDGNGRFLAGVIDQIEGKVLRVRIESDSSQDDPLASIHIALAPTKNLARIEWFVEKAVEIGISRITPVICKHSERSKVRIERLQKIAISAMKQSLQARCPVIDEVIDLKEFLRTTTESASSKFICHLQAETPHLKDVHKKALDSTLLIGPEGDFTRDELILAEEAGFIPVRLGANRLRTETAALSACQIINLINE